jgi:hypothetical protein
MTATERKQKAQDMLMHALGATFYAVGDDRDMPQQEKDAMALELRKQISRIEKLFGYAPGSWTF